MILRLFRGGIYSYWTSKESFHDKTLCSYPFNICMAAVTKYKSTVWRESFWKCEAEVAHTEGSWLDVSLWVSTVQLGDTLWAFKILSGPLLHWMQILSEFSLGASHDYSRVLSRTQWKKNISKAIVNAFGLLPLPRACLACSEQQQGGKQGILNIFAAAANKPLSHQPYYSSGSSRLMRQCLDSWKIRELQISFLVAQKKLKSFCLAGYLC